MSIRRVYKTVRGLCIYLTFLIGMLLGFCLEMGWWAFIWGLIAAGLAVFFIPTFKELRQEEAKRKKHEEPVKIVYEIINRFEELN